MNKKFFPAICLLLISVCSSAQKGFDPGYVVTNSFDTVRGFIKLQPNNLNATTCIFMKAGYPAPRTYSPQELRAYRILDKKYYVSKEVTVDSVKRTLFLEYLVHGIADLYYLKDKAQEYFFIDKGNIMTQLNNNGKNISKMVAEGTADERFKTYYQPSYQYKRMMTVLFQDSPLILKKITYLPYTYRSLINITIDYHNDICKDRACVDYTKSTGPNVFFEPNIGYHMQSMGVRQSTDVARSTGIIAGLNLRLKPFKGYSNWDILFGISYAKSVFDKDFATSIYHASTPGYKFVFRTHANYSLIRIPVTVEYTFPTKVVKPFFFASFINAVVPDFTYSSVRIDQPQGVVVQQFSNYLLGASAGLGVKFQMKGGSYLILKNEYEYIRPGSNETWIWDNSHVDSFRLSLGYGFKIK